MNILVIFPKKEAAKSHFEDKIIPVMPFFKKVDMYNYKYEDINIRMRSFSNPDSLRGYNADLVYLSDECSLKIYNEIIMPIVKNDHSKIRVVI